jgi:hypothetical protein
MSRFDFFAESNSNSIESVSYQQNFCPQPVCLIKGFQIVLNFSAQYSLPTNRNALHSNTIRVKGLREPLSCGAIDGKRGCHPARQTSLYSIIG